MLKQHYPHETCAFRLEDRGQNHQFTFTVSIMKTARFLPYYFWNTF